MPQSVLAISKSEAKLQIVAEVLGQAPNELLVADTLADAVSKCQASGFVFDVLLLLDSETSLESLEPLKPFSTSPELTIYWHLPTDSPPAATDADSPLSSLPENLQIGGGASDLERADRAFRAVEHQIQNNPEIAEWLTKMKRLPPGDFVKRHPCPCGGTFHAIAIAKGWPVTMRVCDACGSWYHSR